MTRDEAQRIVDQCWQMEVGQRMDIHARDFARMFPTNPFTDMPGIDLLLEKLPGSNYGEFTVEEARDGTVIRIGRHEGRKERVREDWDRR